MSVDMGKLPGPYAAAVLSTVIQRARPLNGADPARVGPFWYRLAQEVDGLGAGVRPPARWDWMSATLLARGYDTSDVDGVLATLLQACEETPSTPSATAAPAIPEGTYPSGAPCGGWLDAYIDYAMTIAPMTPRLFHESAGLWLIGAVIARRLMLPMSFGAVYPNLYIAWVAETTLYHKTTALNIAETFARTYFPQLLAPQDVTYEALIMDLAGITPAQFEKLPEETQKRWQAGRAHAAQRSWCLDEMSGLLASAGKDYNGGLIESLLRLYDCVPSFQRLTVGRGYVEIRHAYMSFLGASTPAALAPHLAAGPLWNDGWWPRFALLTPDDAPHYAQGSWIKPPPQLVNALRTLAHALPASKFPAPSDPLALLIGDGVMAAHDRVSRVIGYDLLLHDLEDERLRGLYGRLPTQAIKIGSCLAAIDWASVGCQGSPRMSIDHYARGVQIMEGWRRSAHRALDLIAREGRASAQDQVLRLVRHHSPEGISARDVGRNMRHVDARVVRDALKALADIGEIYAYTPEGPRGGRPTTKYRLVPE